MRRLPPLVVVAVLVFVAAWFLPVHKNGTTTGNPGWEAFTLALDIHGKDSPLVGTKGLIERISACTNFLMLVAVLLVVTRPGQKPAAWLPLSFDLATFVNLWWLSDGHVADLRIGYWMWLASFALMAIALYLMRKEGKA